MNEKLSQADIDKMLKGEGFDDPPSAKAEPAKTESSKSKPTEGENIELTTNDIDTIGEIGNIFMGSASTTLSMLLNNKIDISTPTVELFDNIEESYVIDQDRVTIEITYTEGLHGTVVLALKAIDSAIIADLMMGGNGTVEKPTVGELQLSAVGEAMNQMVGTASTSLSSMLNNSINISHPVVKLQKKDFQMELKKELLGNPIVTVKFRLRVGNLIDSDIIQFMSIKDAKHQIELVVDMIQNMTKSINVNTSQSVIDNLMKDKNKPTSVSVMSTPEPPPPPPLPPSQNQYCGPTWQNIPPPMQEIPQKQVTVQPVQFASFDNSSSLYGTTNQNLSLVMDVKLELTVELGRTELPIKNVLELTRGSIIELDKIAGEPVELYANGKLIAKGEVVVIEDNFGLRISSIISPENRIKDL
jgi:flagellar motor switch protein FliN/FliY